MNSDLERIIEESFGLLRKVLDESNAFRGESDYRKVV
jgi:hypothetical protein